MLRRSAGRSLAAAAAAACTAVLAAACAATPGSQSAAQSSPPTAATQRATPATSAAPTSAPPSPAPSPSATATATAGTTACSTSALTVTAGKGTAYALGGISVPIYFANASSAPCTLYGYPGVSFVSTTSGSQIGAAASRSPGVAPATVTLAPGDAVVAFLVVGDAGKYGSACVPVTAHRLRVYPPGQYSAAYISYTATVCSGQLPHRGSQLSVFAVSGGGTLPAQPSPGG